MTTFRDLIGPGRFIEPAVIQASARSGSTRYPYAAWMPIPENATQPRIAPTQFIMHSMAGPRLTTIEALWHYISRSDITGESTFIGDMDGRMAQTVEANVRADNNYKANPRAVSIETQDRGYLEDPGIHNTPWSDPQMAQHAGLAAWLNLRFGIPIARPTAWDGPGMDGHRAFKEWSVYTGKTCPGDARWAQIPDVLAAARWITEWTPDDEENEMTEEQEAKLDLAIKLSQRVLDTLITPDAVYEGYPSLWQMVEKTNQRVAREFPDPT